jgi:hypothetical protein
MNGFIQNILNVDSARLLLRVGLVSLSWLLSCDPAKGQNLRLEEEFATEGIVRSIQPGRISILASEGRFFDCKVQNQHEEALMVGGIALRAPALIKVTGKLPASLLEKGLLVEFSGRTTESGKPTELLSSVTLASQDERPRVDFLERPATASDGAKVEVVGRVVNLAKTKLYLQVPKGKWARQERMIFELTDDAVLEVDVNNLNAVRPGDKVTHVKIHKISSGDLIVREISIQLTAARTEFTRSYHDRLEQQFRHLSDEPAEPRKLTSDYFVLNTDLSEREAQILLAKLNTMYELIAKYFGKRPRVPIECFVIRDLVKWKFVELPPQGIAKILEKAGVTISTTVPGISEGHAVVYACDKHGVCQHEAVHAFCAMAFGSTGPVWYSEGMAELGQYWVPGELAVSIDPVVIEFLRLANPKKKLSEIIAPGQITGDSWEAYAWRWALCHLLANHPDYRKRFLTLGLAMMLDSEKSTNSFEAGFGKFQRQISFEYDQFVENFGNGYRVDLCAWDWSVKPDTITSTARIKQRVIAARGWQPTRLKAVKGNFYDFIAEGQWKVSTIDQPVTADGDASGRGRLLGVIFQDFKLYGPFNLGAKGSFVAPEDGQLFVRCADDWNELADNEGEMEVFLRLSPK